MKCPECVKQNFKSIVTPGSGMMTAMFSSPFYDKEGRYHHHDPNTTTMRYSCSNGHKWTTKRKDPCPCDGCDWNLAAGESDDN